MGSDMFRCCWLVLMASGVLLLSCSRKEEGGVSAGAESSKELGIEAYSQAASEFEKVLELESFQLSDLTDNGLFPRGEWLMEEKADDGCMLRFRLRGQKVGDVCLFRKSKDEGLAGELDYWDTVTGGKGEPARMGEVFALIGGADKLCRVAGDNFTAFCVLREDCFVGGRIWLEEDDRSVEFTVFHEDRSMAALEMVKQFMLYLNENRSVHSRIRKSL